MISAVKGEGEITDAVVDTVSSSLSNAIKRTGELGGAISQIVRGTLQDVAEIGTDVGSAAKAVVMACCAAPRRSVARRSRR
jgi:hypothetical protein